MASEPIVVEIYIAEEKCLPMISCQSVMAVAEKGLAGDRYYSKTGFYSKTPGWGAQVTLIQEEAIQAVNSGHNAIFTGAMLHRNLVTRGISLDRLIGKTFSCGDAVLRGTKPFPPCAHLAYLIGKHEVLKYFAYCGGIGAEVVVSGEISAQDPIVARSR